MDYPMKVEQMPSRSFHSAKLCDMDVHVQVGSGQNKGFVNIPPNFGQCITNKVIEDHDKIVIDGDVDLWMGCR